jgi:toxin ParE1/3/4
MAVHLIWSPLAKADFKQGVIYIRKDNPMAANAWRISVLEQIELLVGFPELGRILPEQNSPAIREIVCGRYRIIYRLAPNKNDIEIIRIWHAARGESEFESRK